jgi:CBS domain containing-hemolysin-like protein
MFHPSPDTEMAILIIFLTGFFVGMAATAIWASYAMYRIEQQRNEKSRRASAPPGNHTDYIRVDVGHED